MDFMLITNNPDTATYAVDCGVDFIFVDLEQIGKQERQTQVDSVKNFHSLKDVIAVKQAIGDHKLLVRTNPLHEGSKKEVDDVIDAGASLVMLPMFRSSDDVEQFSQYVDGRAAIVPLIETIDALNDIEALAKLENVEWFHFGLNDLHLAFKFKFVFEAMNEPLLIRAYDVLKNASCRYGIGGVARLDEGLLPGRSVLSELLYHGADTVILSRTFHRNSTTTQQLKSQGNLAEELKKLTDHCETASQYSDEQSQRYHEAFFDSLSKITAKMDK